MERQSLEVDIACVGFGPAMGGFLTVLQRALQDPSTQSFLQSKAMPGMPLQVVCYERADDIGFGVSGVVSKGRAIRETFPDLNLSEIPMSAPIKKEKLVYLLDPVGASRRSRLLRLKDLFLNATKRLNPFFKENAMEFPFIPPFMHKTGGFVLSIGQFNQWVGSGIQSTGLVQIWPGMPVKEPIIAANKVSGIRLVDQGVDKKGNPTAAFMPGMDVKAPLTVVGDGPVGPVGQKLDEALGFPEGHHLRDWALGMKMVVELSSECALEPGTVLHTFGYPEPEIFGFLYVYPDRLASLGIFVPSWLGNPSRTAYRYLQHWMLHPYLWKHLAGGTLKSWGAKTLGESGRRGEPFLAGDGFARIGEGSGSTNVLTGSGVDEAWKTGTLLAEGVIELLKEGKEFSKENLDKVYVEKRRQSWLEKEAKIAEKSRDGFQYGFIPGFIGMALSGLTGGLINVPARVKRPQEHVKPFDEFYKGKITEVELDAIRRECRKQKLPVHDAIMDKLGWPQVPLDGKLLVSHQDVLLMGGKVQAADGFADHVRFLNPVLCGDCSAKTCIDMCSAQAIMPGEKGAVPEFDREKCIHCGACLWSCTKYRGADKERSNVDFGAGSGGLHSAQN